MSVVLQNIGFSQNYSSSLPKTTVCPEFHDQASRESNHQFVNDVLDVSKVTTELAYDINDVVNVFFEDNGLPTNGPE